MGWLLTAGRGTSGAFHTESYDALELKCRSTISKGLTKAVTLGQKVVSGCHKSRDKSGAAVDCNVLDASNADAKGKFAKSQEKLIAGVQKACTDAAIDDDVLEEYVSCPEPCATELALPNPLTTYAQVGQCLACVAREEAEANGLAVLGLPAAPLGSAEQACRLSIGKFYGKYLKTMLKDRSKCEELRGERRRVAPGRHHLRDGRSERQDRLDAPSAQSAVDTSCAGANLADLDSCANDQSRRSQGVFEDRARCHRR